MDFNSAPNTHQPRLPFAQCGQITFHCPLPVSQPLFRSLYLTPSSLSPFSLSFLFFSFLCIIVFYSCVINGAWCSITFLRNRIHIYIYIYIHKKIGPKRLFIVLFIVYTTYKDYNNIHIFYVIEAAFIWSKIIKQYNSQILLQFKITVFI